MLIVQFFIFFSVPCFQNICNLCSFLKPRSDGSNEQQTHAALWYLLCVEYIVQCRLQILRVLSIRPDVQCVRPWCRLFMNAERRIKRGHFARDGLQAVTDCMMRRGGNFS